MKCILTHRQAVTHHYRSHPLQQYIPAHTEQWSSLWGSWAPQTSDLGRRCLKIQPTCPGKVAQRGSCPVCTAGCTRSSGCTGSLHSGSHSACLLGKHLAECGTHPHLEYREGCTDKVIPASRTPQCLVWVLIIL